ncbi:MAG: hypothetical protein RL009_1222, partial [Actinomycetota bacterium]
KKKHHIVIIGGGPGGYEAALAGVQLGAQVTLIERNGVGGSAVLTDVVPSKGLIATADAADAVRHATELGIRFKSAGKSVSPEVDIDLGAINQRLLQIAKEQSSDMQAELTANWQRPPRRQPPRNRHSPRRARRATRSQDHHRRRRRSPSHARHDATRRRTHPHLG